jgi:hypothetical protein
MTIAAPLLAQYAGDAACAHCHAALARSFHETGMAQSLASAVESVRAPASISAAGITYRVAVRNGKAYQESVREGSALESHELLYAIGSGTHGRSYVIARGDALYLAPLSYYSAKQAWDLSPGFAGGTYRDFLRPVTASCLFCHAGTASVQPAAITCERCHGPGEAHARQPRTAIVNPAKLSAPLRDDVCYQCHLDGDIRILKPGRVEWDYRPGAPLGDVIDIFSLPAGAKPGGPEAAGQVVQLRASRCWQQSAGRLSCITCHDPHVERAGPQAVAYYRSRCLGCHTQRACTAPARRRNATSPPDNCVSCHMPKAGLNRIAHVAQTSHRIFRRAEQALDPSLGSGSFDLIYESGREPGLRSSALAYGVCQRSPPEQSAYWRTQPRATRATPTCLPRWACCCAAQIGSSTRSSWARGRRACISRCANYARNKASVRLRSTSHPSIRRHTRDSSASTSSAEIVPLRPRCWTSCARSTPRIPSCPLSPRLYTDRRRWQRHFYFWASC